MLHDHNTFVQRFKQVMDMPTHGLPQWEVVIRVDGNVDKRHYNAPTAPEVARLLLGEVLQQCVLLCYLFVVIVHLMQCSSFIDINVVVPTQAAVTSRLQAGISECVRVPARGDGLWRISDLHPAYNSLHFVLFHPHGEPGWQLGMPHVAVAPVRRRPADDEEEGDAKHVATNAEPAQSAQDASNEEEGDAEHVAADAGLAQLAQSKKITAREWACYHMHDRNLASHALFVYGKHLYQEWVVDQYSKVESQRLFYIRNNQGPLRAAIYGGVADAIANNDANIDNLGRLIILPSSFIGGHRHMAQLYQDSMAIVRQYGKPNLFITMTCNPKWENIVSALKPGEIANDRPDLVTRVFVGKLQHLLDELLKKGIFGEVVANIHVIEWHKRGLPHAHILLILHFDHKPRGPDEYDRMVSAELPDKDAHPTLFEVVTSCMLHGPYGTINPHCPCMIVDVCSKGYPKAFTEHTTDTTGSYLTYHRRDDGHTFEW
jgi:hypothetical protein